jgi:flagellar protein FlaJ
MGLVKKMAAFSKRVFPEKFLRNLDHRLESTKIALAAEEYVGVTLLAAILVGVAVGFVGMFLRFPIPASLLALLAAIVTFPVLTLGVPYYLAQRRAVELERALPDALRQIASTLRAGMGIDAAMEDIVKSKYGVLSQEFDRVVTEIRRGRKLDSALLALAGRSNSPLYERAFHLIVEGIERGAALASVLDSVSTDIKEVHAIQRERRAATMQQVLFLLAVALFAVPFIVGLTVAVSGIQIGVGPAAGAGPPAEMGTIALGYIVIQALICSLAVGVIRYGKMLKGLTFAVPFMVASAIVFYVAQGIVGGIAPI